MSAGRGTPRVALTTAEIPGGGTIIVSDQRWISQQFVETGPQELTDDYAAYSLDGYAVPLGGTRAGFAFVYTPGEDGAQVALKVQIGGLPFFSVAKSPPALTGTEASLELYSAVYQTPPAGAGLDPISGYLEFPVPLAGFSTLTITLQVLEVADSHGTIEISRVFSDNYGQLTPSYPIQ